MKRNKNQNGITLVALIITIIVLLILAVVAIRAVQGDGIIAHAKSARDEYGRTSEEENQIMQNYADYIAENIGNGQGESTVQTKLHLGGVYKSTAIANEGGSFHLFISCNAEGTAYSGIDIWNANTGLPNWSQKYINTVSYNEADKITLTMGGQSVALQILNEGESYIVPAAVLNALNGSEITSTDVTFTYTGESFAEHETYMEKKYIINGYGDNSYIIFHSDGSFTVNYSNYPEYSGTYTNSEGLSFSESSFSLDGLFVSWNDMRDGHSWLDIAAVLEDAIK